MWSHVLVLGCDGSALGLLVCCISVAINFSRGIAILYPEKLIFYNNPMYNSEIFEKLDDRHLECYRLRIRYGRSRNEMKTGLHYFCVRSNIIKVISIRVIKVQTQRKI